MLRFFNISSSRSQLTMTHKVHVASFIAPGGSIIFRPRNVALEIFLFCFGFKTQQRAFLGYLYVLFLDASRALDEWCAYAGLVCCDMFARIIACCHGSTSLFGFLPSGPTRSLHAADHRLG